MSVPSVLRLICISVVERIESYILSLANHFYKPGRSTLIVVLNDNKAIPPALNNRYRRIPADTYKYKLNPDRRIL